MSTPAQSGDSLQQELNQVEQQEQQDQQEVQQDVDQGNPSPSGRDSTPSSPREQPNSGSSRRARNSATFEPPPDYLNPSPNPLNFPTKPEEVDIVGTQPITLRQAVDLAIRNNPELQQARLDLESAKAQLRQAEAAYYPSLDATASLLHQESQSIGSPVLLDQNNPAGGSRVPVVAENSTALRGTVSLTYNIYTSGQRPATVKAAEGTVQFRQLDVERQTEDLILNTITDYYDLQQAAENVRINQSTVTASQQSLRDSQALERAGVGTRFDVLQAEVRLANDQQQLVQSLSNLEIARRRLVQRLNLAQSVNIATADPVQPAGVWDLSLPDTIVQAYKNRAELEEQLVQRDIAQQRRRAALAQLGPQLTAQAQTSANSTDLFADNPNNQQDLAFFYSYQAALGVSINLFDGGAAQAQARQQEINIASAESQFNNLQNQIRFQVEQAYYQLQSNFTNIQTTALAVQQAQEALRLARLRFQAGVGTQTDVLNQQTELTRAEVNRLNAVLDYNRALATLQRSVSNFPEGYLSDVP
jgi:outer membrane protein TolC